MATTHANDQYYDSEEDKVQFCPLESYIDSSRADHEQELEEAEEAERMAVAEGEEGEEIGLGEVEASVDEGVVEDENAGNEQAEQSGRRCQRRARDRRPPCLPPVPQFNPFVHTTARHEQHTRYPTNFNVNGEL